MANIVFILNGALDKGVFSGGDRHTVGLLKHCISSGDKVRIIAPEGTKNARSEDVPEAKWIITEHGDLPERFDPARAHSALVKYFLRTLKGRSAKAEPCDIIYSGSILPHETLVASAWKERKLARSYVCRCDQVFHLEPFRQKPEYFLQRTASRIGIRTALDCADLVITMNSLIGSQWDRAKREPESRPRIKTVLYGLDSDLTPFKDNSEKNLDIAFFTRLDHVKGADLLPAIMKELAQKKPDIKLLVIGDGPLADPVKAELDKTGLAGNVEWKGVINSDERFKWLAQARVLLYPTREDSFAKTVSEALALGLPVVSSDHPHFHSVYNDTLIYAESEDPASYAEHILRLLDDTKLYEEYSKKAVAFASTLPPSGNYEKFRSLMLKTLEK